jgi:hypothetical protein
MLGGMNRRAILLTAAAAAGSLLLTACGGSPVKYEPSGVDELAIPTPSPDPDDFVTRVDNPWLPLAAGSRWVYDSAVEQRRTTTVTVDDQTREVQGLTTTVVQVVSESDGKVVARRSDWYAQDTSGNVWYFGADVTQQAGGGDPHAGSWQAGVDGARAGLAMPAQPRVGDGYRQDLAPGTVEDRATVLSLSESVNVPFDSFTDVLMTENTDELTPGVAERRYYARGVGLVYTEGTSGSFDRVQLVDFTHG